MLKRLAALRDFARARLIPDIRTAWRFWSLRLIAAEAVWQSLPPELVTQFLPAGAVQPIGVAIAAAAGAARLIQQAAPKEVRDGVA